MNRRFVIPALAAAMLSLVGVPQAARACDSSYVLTNPARPGSIAFPDWYAGASAAIGNGRHGYIPHPNAYRKITPRHKRGTRGRRDNHPHSKRRHTARH